MRAAAALDDWTTLILRELGIDSRYDSGFFPCVNRLKTNGMLYYSNRYNAAAGTIIAESNYGQVDCHRAPARWSEVCFAMWKLACGQDPARIGSLRFIVQKFIVNVDSINLLSSLIPDTLWHTRHAHPFTPNDPGFFALLNCPNVIGPAHITINYAASLGGKRVRKITPYFFSEINVYYMVIEFGL